jgi:hypothetical protein
MFSRRLWPMLLALVLFIPVGDRVAASSEGVDLLLVLAVDVSRSISDPKFELERRGYAKAFSDPQVLRAIADGPEGRIAVALVEWAGEREQRLVVDWTVIGGPADATTFAGKLLNAPRSFYGRTALGSALEFAARQIARAPFASDRKVIDVSGDGTSNQGREISQARDEALAGGVTTINGIVILTDPTDVEPYLVAHTNPPGGLAAYYRENVIGGPGAFVITAEGFETFGRSLVAKLVREIS